MIPAGFKSGVQESRNPASRAGRFVCNIPVDEAGNQGLIGNTFFKGFCIETLQGAFGN
ncbi:MAG: hypothetical protein HGA59_01240 [Chlorobiaceae bacterium]|nr:hypothetical protein [Chlorobiaceae bacterium]NTV16023.1 hypothetical protein [Chlorobiaceae bacterium]